MTELITVYRILTCSKDKDVKAQIERGWDDEVPTTKAIDVSEDAIYQAVIEDIS